MSENERTQLSDEQSELIVGGQCYFFSSDLYGHYIYSELDQSTRYTFDYSNMLKIKIYIRDNCKGLSDDETLAKLQQQGLIATTPTYF